jgi:hypothetical protein
MAFERPLRNRDFIYWGQAAKKKNGPCFDRVFWRFSAWGAKKTTENISTKTISKNLQKN